MIRLPKKMIGADAQRFRSESIAEFLDSPSEICRQALLERNWIAVPVPGYITDEQGDMIEAALRELDSEAGLAIATDPRNTPTVYSVRLTSLGLNQFHAHCMLSSFLLIGDKKDFALLDQGNYFYVIAGPPRFVKAAVGGSIRDARAAFLRYADDPKRWRRQDTWNWLLDTAARYAEI